MAGLGPIVTAIPEGAIVCDVRWYPDGSNAEAAFAAGHIPGAVFVDLDVHLAEPASAARGRHPMPSPRSFASSMDSLGIRASDTIVVYDDLDGMRASRLVWMLRILGVEAALLDGGMKIWAGPIETGPSVPVAIATNGWQPTNWPASAMANIDETAIAAATSGTVVIDARGRDRFRGEIEPLDPQAGHIPGAKNAPYTESIGTDARTLPVAELRQLFEAVGATATADVIVYCGSGVSACHNMLTLEHAGVRNIRLFPGSWSQWSNDATRPIATGS